MQIMEQLGHNIMEGNKREASKAWKILDHQGMKNKTQCFMAANLGKKRKVNNE